jgi:hypothetical protein
MHARLIRCAMTGLVLVVTGGSSVVGCLDRPVVPGEPTTKTNFTTTVATQAVDKLDILFSIDNSASMGDKQAYLEAAIPDLINRLITPNCISDADGTTVTGVSTIDPTTGTATCAGASAPEFPPVHNMHIGVLSSSLGNRLGNECLTEQQDTDPNKANSTITINGTTLDRHEDDQAHLITRSSDPTIPVTGTPTEVDPLPDGDDKSGFLAWYPTSNTAPAQAGITVITSGTTLEADFADVIAGVHSFGCGIESQLENWYRFLIQPDPYASLGLTSSSTAQWVGVDTTILKQRHDFLRPDSLVAIIVLTDENDSEIDVRSISGQGYLWMSTSFTPPHGTAVCSTNPADPNCTTLGKADPAPYNSQSDWGYNLNLRHVHMQAKYGLNPQFPLSRYVNGLTSGFVPDRTEEYPNPADGYDTNSNDYKCVNPLFAASLPDGTTLSSSAATSPTLSTSDRNTLCNLLPSNARSKNLIFYAIIGGVPWQLLHFDPNSAKNSLLTSDDWVRILGTDPDNYNYTGIDPHMVESYQPRTSTPFATATPLPALTNASTGISAAETAPQPATGGNTDPYNGREWTTNVGNHIDLVNVDREYACIFKLEDKNGNPTPRDCTNTGGGQVYTVPANQDACDCSSVGLTPDEVPPVCDPANNNSQLYAKAYPTIRELNLANKLGTQGIVSSICPIDVADNASSDDPLYGYRPAVSSIINRLKTALTNQCLPQTLEVSDAGTGVPCLILATLESATNPSNPQADCSNTKTYPSLSEPDATILAQFQAAAHANWLLNNKQGVDPSTLPTCQVAQLTGSQVVGGTCKGSQDPGWCYVTGVSAGTCPQAIIFTQGAVPTGATINLQCIETSSAIAGGAPTDGG